MFEQLGTIHPALPPGAGLLALLAGSSPHRACVRETIEHHLG
jgi:hypothetical protein